MFTYQWLQRHRKWGQVCMYIDTQLGTHTHCPHARHSKTLSPDKHIPRKQKFPGVQVCLSTQSQKNISISRPMGTLTKNCPKKVFVWHEQEVLTSVRAWIVTLMKHRKSNSAHLTQESCWRARLVPLTNASHRGCRQSVRLGPLSNKPPGHHTHMVHISSLGQWHARPGIKPQNMRAGSSRSARVRGRSYVRKKDDKCVVVYMTKWGHSGS